MRGPPLVKNSTSTFSPPIQTIRIVPTCPAGTSATGALSVTWSFSWMLSTAFLLCRPGGFPVDHVQDGPKVQLPDLDVSRAAAPAQQALGCLDPGLGAFVRTAMAPVAVEQLAPVV